jgi:hypothetical protein
MDSAGYETHRKRLMFTLLTIAAIVVIAVIFVLTPR